MRRLSRRFAAATVVLALVQTSAAHATISEWALSFERLLGGIKVFDRQISGSSQQTQQVIKKTREAAVNTELAQEQALRLADIKNRFSYEYGQGESSCTVTDGRSGLSGTDNSQTKMLSAFNKAEQKYLSGGGNAAANMKNSLLKRIGHYCTDVERFAMGEAYCRSGASNERNAGDSNAAPFLVNRNYGSAEVVTAADYIDVLAPYPTVSPEAVSAGTTMNLIDARMRAAALSASRSTMMGIAVSGMGGDKQ